MTDTSASAHQHWNEVWKTPAGRAAWSVPDPWVAETVTLLRERKLTRSLDVGCGVGRHTNYLADEGLRSVGVDRSTSAVQYARGAGAGAAFAVARFDGLPFRRGSFDFVLAFNVIYHGDEATLRRALGEVRRVLRPGGLFQSTMLSKRNAEYGRGIEVGPNTFRRPDAEDDKVHPHLYCDEADLERLHDGLRLISAVEREQGTAGSYHWHCLFEVPAG